MAEPGSPAAGVILDIQEVDFSYGGSQALSGCTFGVNRATVTGLIGPNGAGKSTLIEIIAGGLRPSAGTITFEGADIAGLGRVAIAKRGIVRTFQTSRELLRLPVIENVMLAAQNQYGENLLSGVFGKSKWAKQEKELREEAATLLEWVGLGHAMDQRAGSLSGGQRRLLDMARALMAKPKMLLLDEPTAGVYPAIVQLMAERINDVAKQGLAVLVVAHNMAFLEWVADDVVVMDQGRMLTRGHIDEVRRNELVTTAYLGG